MFAKRNILFLCAFLSAVSGCGGGGSTPQGNDRSAIAPKPPSSGGENTQAPLEKPKKVRQERLSYNINKGSDDAQEIISTGVITLNADKLSLGANQSTLTALRFNQVEIPRNAFIESAYLQFSAHQDNTDAKNANINIALDQSVNSQPLNKTKYNLSSRAKTANQVTWAISNSAWNTVNESGDKQRTPDLTALVKEIIDNPKWEYGNAMTFLLEGDGLRNIISYESSINKIEVSDLSATLVIKLSSLNAFRPHSGDDDAEENIATGKVSTNGSDLELGWDGSTQDAAQKVGIRFTNINITPNSTIHKAYIQFTQDDDKNLNPFEVSIHAEDSAQPKAFENTDKNISNRKLLSTQVDWKIDANWTVMHESGLNQRTPDLSALVQELVNKNDWRTGNAMSFILEGTGRRTAEPFESGPDLTPKLVIEYTNASNPNVFDKIRLAWNDDPTTTMTVIWNQEQVNYGVVHYDEYKDTCPTDLNKYRFKQTHHRHHTGYGMNTAIARLTSLKPDTRYRFIIESNKGNSECSWFKTAPNTPKPFSYISGGDTKSSGNQLRAARWSNEMVSKVRPLFILFTGDFNSGQVSSSFPGGWKQWLEDWSTLTRSDDGRMYPIIPVHGNHENFDYEMLYQLFDTSNHNPNESSNVVYNAYSFGGNLLYLVTLNSELRTRNTQYNRQTSWFENTMATKGQNHALKVAGYHKPMRPHTDSKSEDTKGSATWAPIMEQYGINVAYESDTHLHTFTYPIRLAKQGENGKEGFIRDDVRGTMHVGEGSWGAGPRKADDKKDWTLNSESFYQIKLNRVYPAQNGKPAHIDISVLKTAEEKDGKLINYVQGVRERDKNDPMALPKGATLHNTPGYGDTITIPFKAKP